MGSSTNFHESFQRVEVERGSERNFGFVVAGALVVIALFPLVRGGEPRWLLLPFSIAFALFALIAPWVLRPLNILWHRLGLVLQKVVNPVVMLAIFGIAVVPTGLILRAMGKDPMRRRYDPRADTYWIARNPPGPPPQSMENQF